MIIHTSRESEDSIILQSLKFTKKDQPFKDIISSQKTVIILCVVIILLLLAENLSFILGIPILRTKQVGLITIVDNPGIVTDIPDYDDLAIVPPEDDSIVRLNEKLDEGKMCISMISSISFKNSHATGHFNIYNDEANKYPQFVTIILDNNNTQIYQSGLIDVGKCIPYDSLDVALPKGEYECTAVFSQVNTSAHKICGQTAAKIKVTIQN